MKVNIWKEFKKVFSVARKEFLIKLVSSLVLRGVLLAIPVLFSMSVNYATKGDYINALLYIIFSILVTIFYRLTEGVNQRLYYNLYTNSTLQILYILHSIITCFTVFLLSVSLNRLRCSDSPYGLSRIHRTTDCHNLNNGGLGVLNQGNQLLSRLCPDCFCILF